VIVGIAQSIRYVHTTEKPMDFVYLPFAQRPAARMVLLLRSTGGPMQVLEPLRSAVRAIDANLPIVDTRTYETLYRYNVIDGPGIAINLAGIMGLMALALAIAGLYGLVAYNVTRRTREIGIRMAIGARPADVLRLVLGKGLTLVGTGTLLGLVMGFAVERIMNTALFNTGGVDVGMYAVLVPTMFVVTMLAAYVPALRASRIQPTQALRYE
jgi:putative ABC transport system permease protein